MGGFYALGLLSEIHGPALVIRGTEPATLLDWWANSDWRGVGYSQFDTNYASVAGWLQAQSERVDIIGHSLGGAVAPMDRRRVHLGGGLIDQLVTFNSPGISNSPIQYPSLRTYADQFVPGNATTCSTMSSMATW